MCNTEFQPKNSTQKFCSLQCSKLKSKLNYELAKTPKVNKVYEKTCICGKKFSTNNIHKKYCDKKCYPLLNYNKYPLICVICNKPFNGNTDKTKTCSKECLKMYYSQVKASKKPNKINKLASSYNLHESARILIRPIVEDIINRSMENGNEFNGTLIDYRNINFDEKIKTEILERDEHRCKVCNAQVSLHVHHIISRQLGGSHDEKNLITLCVKCHRHIETGDIEHAVQKCTRNFISILNDKSDAKNDRLSNKQIIKIQNEFIRSIFEKLSSVDKSDEVKEVMCSIDNFLGNLNIDE